VGGLTSRSLLWAGVCDFAVAAALAVTFFLGPSAYSFFGVEFLADLAAAGSSLPALISGGLAVLGILAGLYSLSGAGYGPRLPLVRTVLVLVTMAFLARGAWLAVELARVIPNYQSVRFRELLLSATALTIGFLHLTGLRQIAEPSASGR
jgi:hypothetical protein